MLLVGPPSRYLATVVRAPGLVRGGELASCPGEIVVWGKMYSGLIDGLTGMPMRYAANHVLFP